MYLDNSPGARNVEPDLPPAAADTSNQFSLANVVGMFITLQLCQLTQPYGSLLFQTTAGAFWRSNPIASLVEALIIFRHLVAAAVRSRRSGGSSTPAALFRRLQGTASALLLLRGASAEADGGEALLATLLADTPPSEPAEGVELQERSAADTSSADVLPESARARPVNTTVPHAPSLQPPLESNRPPPPPQTERSRALHAAFGANALAHRELRIDLLTALAELTVLVKLAAAASAATGPFVAAGVAMVTGWASVQALLVLVHAREMGEREMAAAVRELRVLRRRVESEEEEWGMLFAALHFPFFVYVAYLASGFPWAPKEDGEVARFLKTFLMMYTGFIASPYMIILAIVWSYYEQRWPWKLFHLLVWPTIGAWASFSSWIYIFRANGDNPDEYFFFPVDTMKYRIFDKGMESVYNFVLFVLFIVVLAIFYFAFFFLPFDDADPSSKGIDRIRNSLGNISFTAIAFYIFLASYDESKTFKPPWTEFLG